MQNICKIVSNSNVRLINEAVKASVLRVKDPTAHTGRIETLAAFLLSRANGSAITRISDSWLKPYTDEPLNEPRRPSVNQATRKTGKMGYMEIGLLYRRLIIELISYADSRHCAGYNVE
jgi:hypothetical protein